MNIDLFPFAQFWWFYGLFTLFVLALLAVDLGVFHRKAHAVSYREAALWSAVWVALALASNYALYHFSLWWFSRDPRLAAIPGFNPSESARQVALEFLTGYIIEKTLSVDNIFLFVVVFAFFAIPPLYQHRILFFGVLGALVFRSIFIAIGSALLNYHWIIWLFGGFLILTGIKMFFARDLSIDPDRNPLVRLFRKMVPITTETHGQRFLVRIRGTLHATPLLLALLFIELSDIVFAVDSVPAIFAITREPLIVFTSNVFAILGLRSLYFLLAGAVHSFHMLKYGLALVLVFVGLKMAWLNDLFGGKFPIGSSLAIIGGIVAVSILLSLFIPKKSTPQQVSALPFGISKKRFSHERSETMKVREYMKRNLALFAAAFFLIASNFAVAGVAQDTRAKQDLNGIHARLAKEVRHELVMLPFYSLFDNLAFRIEGVDTVVLMGQVTRPALKQDAENVVRKVEGVGKVVNNIEVLPLSPNDDRIRRAAYRAIYSRAGLDRYALSAVPSIHIIVKNGNITLEGVVAAQADKDQAGIAAKGVSGAFAVTNNLRIESK